MRLGEYRLPVTFTLPAFEGGGNKLCVDSRSASIEVLR
jgi:hypothetical protein